MYEELTKCLHFTWLLPEKLSKYSNFYICQKINKIPEFYDFCPKNAKILHNCPKNLFPEFFFWGGVSPVSYAYMSTVQPSGLFKIITVTCFWKKSRCPTIQVSGNFIFQQDSAQAHRARSFSNINILEGSAAIDLKRWWDPYWSLYSTFPVESTR